MGRNFKTSPAIRYSTPSETHGKDSGKIWYSVRDPQFSTNKQKRAFSEYSKTVGDNGLFGARTKGGGFLTGYNEHAPGNADYYHEYDDQMGYPVEGYTALNRLNKRGLDTVTYNDVTAGAHMWRRK